jgi:excisionase family DNA binding protein
MSTLLHFPEVAERLGVSLQRAYELGRDRIIPTVRLGRQVRVDAGELEEFIKRGGAGLDEREVEDA